MKRGMLGILVIMLCVVDLAFVDQALADPCTTLAINCDPPAGNVVLDLNGTPVPHEYQQYSVDFTAVDTTTNISFAFREDPAYLLLDDVSVTTGGGPNLLLNPGFELGPIGANAPTNWTYLNEFGATAAGVVSDGACHTGALCYVDGAVQAYDAITQGIATTVGSLYTVSFFLNDTGDLTTFSRLSTSSEDSNGIDLLVYAGGIPTISPDVPEPATWLLLGSGLVGLAAWRRKKAA